MILAAKGKGSYCIFTTREHYLKDLGYQKKMDELEAQNKWKLLKTLDVDRYDKLGEE